MPHAYVSPCLHHGDRGFRFVDPEIRFLSMIGRVRVLGPFYPIGIYIYFSNCISSSSQVAPAYFSITHIT